VYGYVGAWICKHGVAALQIVLHPLADDLISMGTFDGEGLDMRSSGIQGLFRLVVAAAAAEFLVKTLSVLHC
jgi:hypothetical protein